VCISLQISKQRDVVTTEAARVGELGNEVDISRATLAKTSSELADAGNSNAALQQALVKKQSQIESGGG
jgi:hypothetical protein